MNFKGLAGLSGKGTVSCNENDAVNRRLEITVAEKTLVEDELVGLVLKSQIKGKMNLD